MHPPRRPRPVSETTDQVLAASACKGDPTRLSHQPWQSHAQQAPKARWASVNALWTRTGAIRSNGQASSRPPRAGKRPCGRIRGPAGSQLRSRGAKHTSTKDRGRQTAQECRRAPGTTCAAGRISAPQPRREPQELNAGVRQAPPSLPAGSQLRSRSANHTSPKTSSAGGATRASLPARASIRAMIPTAAISAAAAPAST